MGAGAVQAAPADPASQHSQPGPKDGAKDGAKVQQGDKKPIPPALGKFEALRRFGQVLDIVEHSYVKDVGQQDLVNGAIKGMLQGLDPHSTFMNAEEYKEMQETTSGEFFGIGIEISMENGQVTVVTPIEDTPAFKAGMQTGDVILAIDGQSTQELSLQEVVSRIRGPKGTAVELTVLHAREKKPVAMRIVRDAIPLISVKSKRLEDGYYWIRLTRFSEKTTDELKDALAKAGRESKAAGGIKGIVLDLRSNPGGLLNQAVGVSDAFLSEGTIVSIKGRSRVAARTYTAKPQDTDVHVPMVVLVNAGSASASEIVAGALRDQKRAVIVGERSFGKGSVQNIIPLADGSGLKLTVALYYTPNGSSIQAEGIVPDIEVPFEPQDKDADDSGFMVRERDLSRHIENRGGRDAKEAKDAKDARDAAEGSKDAKEATKESGKDAAKDAKEKKGKDEESQKIARQLKQDNQLRMALQIVKGLPRMQSIKN
ncbi:MAG: PDZ domain-containing protein [Desulfovibrio sp.]|nr:PDZ domain-containing protein [Desulfovibrio sp.]